MGFSLQQPLHQTVYNAYILETGTVEIKSRVSLHVKTRHSRHIAWFHKHGIEPKYMCKSDWKFSQVHVSVKSVKMNISMKLSEGRRCIFVGGPMGYPPWSNYRQIKSEYFKHAYSLYVSPQFLVDACDYTQIRKYRQVDSLSEYRGLSPWWRLRFSVYQHPSELTLDLEPPCCSIPFNRHGLSLITAWISNHESNKIWDEATYPSPNHCAVEIWEW